MARSPAALDVHISDGARLSGEPSEARRGARFDYKLARHLDHLPGSPGMKGWHRPRGGRETDPANDYSWKAD